MSPAIRSILILALACGLIPTVANAQQLRQPASVLPLNRSQPAAKRVIQAPEAELLPHWLLQANKAKPDQALPTQKVAQRTATRKAMPMVETEDFSWLGDIEAGLPSTSRAIPQKTYRPRLSPSKETLEGPELRLPGTRRAQKSRTLK